MNPRRSAIKLMCVFISLTGGWSIATNEKGIELFDKEDYQSAYQEFYTPASEGDATAQVYLGWMYSNGWGVDKDYTQAVSWYRKAAEQGDTDGQDNLGVMYSNGWGVDKDYTQAVSWYRKAAEQGNAYGQDHLGVMYENGWGVQQDYAQAVSWYKRAADHGDLRGQYHLAFCYEFGMGVPKDLSLAKAWYEKAAQQNHEEAISRLSIVDGILASESNKNSGSIFQTVTNTPPAPEYHPTGDLYLLAVGINAYQDRDISPLNYAAKDSSDLAAFFRTQEGKAYRKVNVTLLTNGQATRRRIIDALDDIVNKASENDTVILSFSSHGENASGDYYLLTNDTQSANLAGTALSGRQVLDAYTRLRSNTLMILDSCFAGAVSGTRGARSTSPDQFISRATGVMPVGKATKTIISAASNDQEANEGNGLPNGYFTFAFLEGLKSITAQKSSAKVMDVLTYTAERVPALVIEKGGKPQDPNINAGRLPTWIIAKP